MGALETFLAAAAAEAARHHAPAHCVRAICPLMLDLIHQAGDFLEAKHFRSDPAHYTRNLIHAAPDNSLSLYALVWLPGQWTPVHDHGSWGVVGVIEGVLEERAYVRLTPDRGADAGIELVEGGMVLLARGAVTSFVPNPDHIHVTGVPAERPRAVSLHLYGRMMSNFNIYDVAAGTRSRVAVAHNESRAQSDRLPVAAARPLSTLSAR
jgi:predicted metal-dependent enzyme (double-stranded beta helix superfamily)